MKVITTYLSKSNQAKLLVCSLFLLVSSYGFSQSLTASGASSKLPPATGYVSSPDVSPEIKTMLNYYDKQVYFTENTGQWNSKVLYKADFQLGQAVATKEGMIVGTYNPSDVKAQIDWGMKQEEAIHNHVPFTKPGVKVRGNGWMMNFLNHSSKMSVESQIKHKDVFNYFHGNQSNSDVYSYQEIWYKNVYDNVDVRYYPSKDGSLEYDMICKPGFNKDAISIKMDGISKVILKDNGSLALKTSVGEMNLPTPVAYQNIDGKRVKVDVHYAVSENNIVTFNIGKFDKSQPLLIDPIALRWATWVNSNSTGANHGHGIWIDGSGNIYVVARVDGSTNMITTGAFDGTANGGIDLIIGKYTEPDSVGGSGTRVWQTYVGGSADDNPYACQMGPDGNLYITGYTESTDFPLLGGTAFTGPNIDDRSQGPNNIFVMKITPDGQSIKSSVIGGNADDESYDLRFSSTGDVVVCGNTQSTNLDSLFPGTGATNSNYGSVDVIIFKINSDLSTIKWMRNYGGSGIDQATIMLDNPANDDVYVAGYTMSTNFPTTKPRQSSLGGSVESGFIQKFNSNGNTVWSSYFEAGSGQTAQILCMEFNTLYNQLYFGGITSTLNSNNISAKAYQKTYGGGSNDFFVANMDTAQNFISGTYFGGSGNEVNMMGLNTDLNNDVYVFGYTTSQNFPTTFGALQTTNLGNDNKVFLKLHTTLDSLDFSTYYGGTVDDYDPVGERGIKFSNCRIYTIITSESPDIPLTEGALTTTKLSSTSIYEPGLVVWANPPDLVDNTITGNQSICKGAIPTPLTGSVPVYSLPTISRNNTYTAYPNIGSSTVYQWQLSIDSVNWTNVAGGTTQNLASALMGPLSVTTYYRRIISGDACIIAGAAGQVVMVKVPTVTAGTLTNVSCNGAGNGYIKASPSGPTPWTFSWSTGATTQSISNLTLGTYTVSVTDGNTCTATNTFTITQPNVLAVTIGSATNVACNGNSNGSITANTPTGGTSPYTYSWSPKGGTNITASSLSIGIYTVTVTDAHGCVATVSAALTQPSVLTATASVTTNVSCNGSNNGSGSVTAAGGTPAYTYSWSNGATTSSASGLGAGNFTVTVTDSHGCTATSSITITQPGTLTAAASTSSNISCNGSNNGSASASASGGTSAYIYSWSTGATTTSISGLSAGSYKVTVTDAHGCTATASATISQPNALSANANTTINASCNGEDNGSANVSASGGTSPYTYSWSTGVTTSSVSGLSAGTYTVTVKDAHDCSTSASTIVTQPVALSNTTSQTNVTTYGTSTGSASVTASGGVTPYTYSWSTGATTSSISGLSAGNYSVTVTDADKCTTTATINITQPGGPTIVTTNTNEPCKGDNNATASVSASGGKPPYTYSWSTGATTSSISNLTAGTYSVTVKDANNAPATGDAIVTQPAALTATGLVLKNVGCNGDNNGSGSVNVSGGTSPYAYSWSTGATISSISNLSIGTYTVTVKDANSCSATASITITQPAILTCSANASGNVSCTGSNNGSANASGNGGTSPYTYSWSNAKTTSSISTLTAGTYSVTVTDNNGCTATSSASITQPASLVSAVASTVTNVSCNGGATATIKVVASGGTPSYTYSWSNGATTTSVSGVSAGTYTVTVKDANDCSTTASTVVTQPTAISNTTSQSNVTVYGGNNGTATITVSGGTSPYTYSWSNGATKSSITGLVAGNYSVTATDAHGCTTGADIQITQPGTTVVITGTNESCYGDNNGTATVTPSGGTSPYTYSWSPGGATKSSVSGLSVGTYTVKVTDHAGSSATTSITITEPSALTATGTVSANVSCNGNNNGSGKVTAGGGTSPYTYSWSNEVTTSSVSNLTAGTYNVYITDKNGCAASVCSITITQPGALSASASTSSNVSCNGSNNGSGIVTANGGTSPFTYSWSNGKTTSSVSSLTAGTYTVTVKDANGCSTTGSITITQPTALGVNTTQVNVTIYGHNNGSATATASGGTPSYTYSWSTGATTTSISSLSAGGYTITVKDKNGCSTSTTITITQPSALTATVTITANVSCNDGNNGTASVSASGGTPAYTYSWSTGAKTTSISSLTAGTYTVTVKDALGSSATASAIITQPVVLSASASISKEVSCYESNNGSASASASGGTSPYTYSWSNGATGSSVSSLSAGNYHVSVTDAHGCTATSSSITITQPAILTASANTTGNVSCNGNSNGKASVSASGGTSPYTYSWNTGATTTSISGLSAGTYTITVKDANGCSITAGTTVTQPTVLSNSTTQTNVTTVGGSNGSATVTATGGTTPYTYSWSNGSTKSSISSLTAGTYSVTVTDANDCSTTNIVIITQGPIITVTNTNDACNGGNNATASVSASGGVTPYTYSWSTGATTSSISSLTAGTYSITVKDANDESATASVTVTQPTLLTATGTASTNVSCNGNNNGSGYVTANGGVSPYTYSWSNGKTTSSISSLTAGTYTVTVNDNHNCSTSAFIIITQPNALLASASPSTYVMCSGGNNGSGSVIASGGTIAYTYSWSNGASTTSISGLSAGTYTVTVKDTNGCSATSSMIITQPSALNASASISGNISCSGGNNGAANSSVNGGTAPYTYSWSNGATTSSISGLSAGSYYVAITDAHGCSVTSSTITVTQPSVLTVTASTSGNISCNGGNNGKASALAGGGTLPYTYSWNTGAITLSISGLSAGTYSVTVTDAHNCTIAANTAITQPATLTDTTSQVNVTINGDNNGSASVIVTGGTSPYYYSWSNGAVTSSISSLTAGTYTVTVTDKNDCGTTASVTITQPGTLTIIPINTNDDCYGGDNATASVTASGGISPYTYSWSNGGTTSAISSLTAGTYSVTVTDANDATASTAITVVQRAAIVANTYVAMNVSCNGGNNGAGYVLVNGEAQSYSYSWSTGATTTLINALSAGTYTLTITDAYGCNTTETLIITQPNPLIAPGSSTNLTCNGANNGSASVNVSGGTSPYTYSWSTGATGSSISSLSAGNYNVSVIDSNGCTTTTGITVTQPNTLTAVPTSFNIQCSGANNGSGYVTVSGGTSPYTYSWSNRATTSSISGLTTGSYTVAITDAYGCSTTSSITITQSGVLTVSAYPSNNVYCNGSNTGTGYVNVSGGGTPYTYSWSNGASTSSISGLSAGNYSVTVNDANGCAGTAGITITQPTTLTNVTSQVNLKVNGYCDGSATINPSGGTVPYTYKWGTGATTSSVSSLCAGTYTVTVTDSNGCTTTNHIVITQPTQFVIIPTNTNDICHGDNIATASVSASGGVTPYTYSWSTGASTSAISSLTAGTYSITVMDSNGATASASVVVTQPTSLIAAGATSTNIPCNGGNSGSGYVNVNGGTLPYTYSWSTGATTSSISSLSIGTYTVLAKDAHGCSATASIIITQPPTLTDSITIQTNVSCNGNNNGSAFVSATGGTLAYTYSWNNGATTSSVSGLSAGTYSVTVTDANGCNATAGTSISQPTTLVASGATSTNIPCNGGNIGSGYVTATGGTSPYTYSWSTGATTSSVNSLTAGSYTVVVKDSNGCSAPAYILITQPATLTGSITVRSEVSCNGNNNGSASVSVTGGTLAYTYSWSNGATTSSISGLSAGNYRVYVIDGHGCMTNATVTITQPTTLVASGTTSNNVPCNGGNSGSGYVNATGGTSPYTYSWSTGATTSSVNSLTAGSYTVVVKDSNGCSAPAYIVITQPATLTGSITVHSEVSCNGNNNGSASVSATGGTLAYTYSWSNGAITSSISGLSAGTYSVTVADAHGCDVTASTTITQPTTLVASGATSNNISCNGGNSGSGYVNATGGTSPYTYSWSTGATTSSVNSLTAGSYTVVVKDSNGCSAPAYILITQPATLTGTITVRSEVSCNGNNNGSASVSVNGGTLAYTYSWSNGATTSSVSGLSAGNYRVYIIDAHGCMTNATVSITQPTTLVASGATSTNILCNGGNSGSGYVTATGGTSPYTYSWSTGATTSSISSLTAGTYSVLTKDANGCSAPAYILITQPATLTGTITVRSEVSCNGNNNGSASVSVNGGTLAYTYSWSNGAITSSISGLSAGTYSVTVADAHGCDVTASTTITQPTTLVASGATSNNIFCNGGNSGSGYVTATGGTSPYTYSWSTGATTSSISSLTAGTYSVLTKDANGCSAPAYILITQPATLTGSITVHSEVSCNGNNNGSASVSVNGGTLAYTYSWSNGATTSSVSGLSAGNYSVLVFDAHGCSTSATTTITQPTTLVTAGATSTNILCNGGNSGSGYVTATGGTSPYTYSWSTGATTSSVNSLTAGSYTVVVKDSNGCSAPAYILITQPATLTGSITVHSEVSCNGNNNGSASVSANGGTLAYTYSWSNGATTSSVSGLSAGNYRVYIIDAHGCMTNATVSITQPTTLVASGATSTNILCNGGNSGSGYVTASGGTSPYTYSWSTGATTSSISSLTAGTYSVLTKDANGCEATARTVITQPTNIILTTIQTNVTCKGNGTATVNVSGGTSPYTYKWGSNTGSQTTSTATNLATGIYQVTVIDANGCNAVASVTISQVPGVIASATSVNVTCHGDNNGSAKVTASSGVSPYTYKWSNGATVSSISNLSAGTYTVLVTDINTCTATASVIITQPTAITIVTTQTNVTCKGNGTATAIVSGGTTPYTYKWSNNCGAQTTSTATNLVTGTYTVTVTDSHGCEATASVTISQVPGVTALATHVNITCNGDNNGSATVIASSGVSPYTYKWSNGATVSSISNLSAATYTVKVTDANTCTATASVTITQPTVLTAYFCGITNVSCNGNANGTAYGMGTGGTSPYLYKWNNSETTAIATGLSAGGYTVTVTDAHGCEATASVTITQPASITLTTTHTNVTCKGNGTATAVVSGGTSPYTYKWKKGSQTTSTVTDLAAGTYTVTITDANGCSATASVTISQIPGVVASATSVNVTCHGDDNGSVRVTASSGISPYTYKWSNGATVSSISNLSTGTYTVTVTDVNECTATASVVITQPIALTAYFCGITNVSCNGSNNGTANGMATGGTSPYLYKWNNGETTATGTGLAAGSYTFSVTDAHGCSASTSVTITQPTAITVTTAHTNVTCKENGTATANVSGGTSPYTYKWSKNCGSQTTRTATNLAAGTYTVTVTDAHGCTATAPVTITQPAAIIVTTTQTNATCKESGTATAIVSGGTSPYTYKWSGNCGSQITRTATNLAAGTYTVTVTDASGCTATASVTISQTPGVTISATTHVNVTCTGDDNGSATVTASSGVAPYTYSWSNGATRSSISNLSAGTYTITVSDMNDCTATAKVVITQPSAVTAYFCGITNVTRNGIANGTANGMATGGTSPYVYSWNNGETTATGTGLAAGSYTFTVIDAHGCTASASVTITQPSHAPESHNDGELADTTGGNTTINIVIYPNPTSGEFHVTGLTKGQIIQVYDASGKLIRSSIADQPEAIYNIADRANGLYIVRIIKPDGTVATEKKLVKQW